MNREGQDTLLLFVGVMVLQVGISDLHLRYVKPQMQPLLLAAGIVLTVLAVVSIVRSQRGARSAVVTASPTEHVPGGALALATGTAGPEAPADHGQEHGHSHMPRTAWLLALPLLVLTVITPPSLGAYAAARGTQTSIDAPANALPPLPAPSNGAVELTLTEFSTRALYAPSSLGSERVRLTGFVLPEQDGWQLARIALSCCAADGRPIRVQADGAPAPAADSWVSLEGRLSGEQGEGTRRMPVFRVDSLTPVQAPVQTYE